MNRQEKQQCIAEVQQNFEQSSFVVVLGCEGLSVNQFQGLRSKLREQSSKLQVIKNTLSRRALVGLGQADSTLLSYLKRQVALVFVRGDAAAAAKVVCEYQRDVEKLTIIAGRLDNRVIDHEMVQFLGTLPAQEIIAAQLCGVLKSPLVIHVRLLQQVLVRLLVVLRSIQEKKEAEVQ